MQKIILSITLILLTITLAQAATITGTIYDYSLQKVPGAIVQINTEPPQTIVTTNSTYRLEVPIGEYEIKVSKNTGFTLEEKTQATIKITNEGTYTYDLILFREIQELEEPEIENLLEEKSPLTIISIISIFLVLAGLGVIIGTKKINRPEENEADLEKGIFKFIKEKKRTTQKEIRKTFPYAEATISLALSALEHEEKIIKIKKGRGNIITLKRK